MNASERPLRITIFRDVRALTRIELNISLNEFADHLAHPTHAASKHLLPLFSLCRFGDRRSPKKLSIGSVGGSRPRQTTVRTSL
jgi:hypothetical protein